MTLATAEAVSFWSNWILIAALVVGVIATYGVVVSGNVKEAALKRDIAASNASALEAQLALEKYKAPRTLTAHQQSEISAAISHFPAQRFSGMVAGSVPDAPALWSILAKSLTVGGWVIESPFGLAIGSPPAGVPIVANSGVTIFVPQTDVVALAKPANALDAALKAAGIEVVESIDAGPQARPGVIVIEIGTKP